MTNLLVLPVKSAKALPTIDMTQTQAIFGISPEAGARGHWLLGSDYPTYIDLINGRALLKRSGGADPTVGPNSLSVAGVINSMLTPFLDALVQTQCIVFKRINTVASQSLFGTRLGSALDGSGAVVSSTGGGTGINFRCATNVIQNISFGGNTTVGQFFFAALAEDHSGASRRSIAYIGGIGANEALAQPNLKQASALNIAAIGGYFNGYSDTVEAAEVISFDSFKTTADLDAIYQRTKLRMAQRGVSVV